MADDKLQLYLAHRAALVDYARPIVGCRARAEDVVQEAWLRFSGQQDDADIRHPASYLYRIVRNLALDQTRRTATEKAQPDGDDILAELPSSSASPEQAVSQQNELDAIGRALEELPQRTRIAFEMHRLGGFTCPVRSLQGSGCAMTTGWYRCAPSCPRSRPPGAKGN